MAGDAAAKARAALYDPQPGSVHLVDLTRQVRDNVHTQDRLSDYLIGVLICGRVLAKITLSWEAELYLMGIRKGGAKRAHMDSAGHPFLGPDNKILTLGGAVLHGDKSTHSFEISPLVVGTNYDALKAHPNYETWLEQVLFANWGRAGATYQVQNSQLKKWKAVTEFWKGKTYVTPNDSIAFGQYSTSPGTWVDNKGRIVPEELKRAAPSSSSKHRGSKSSRATSDLSDSTALATSTKSFPKDPYSQIDISASLNLLEKMADFGWCGASTELPEPGSDNHVGVDGEIPYHSYGNTLREYETVLPSSIPTGEDQPTMGFCQHLYQHIRAQEMIHGARCVALHTDVSPEIMQAANDTILHSVRCLVAPPEKELRGLFTSMKLLIRKPKPKPAPIVTSQHVCSESLPNDLQLSYKLLNEQLKPYFSPSCCLTAQVRKAMDDLQKTSQKSPAMADPPPQAPPTYPRARKIVPDSLSTASNVNSEAIEPVLPSSVSVPPLPLSISEPLQPSDSDRAVASDKKEQQDTINDFNKRTSEAAGFTPVNPTTPSKKGKPNPKILKNNFHIQGLPTGPPAAQKTSCSRALSSDKAPANSPSAKTTIKFNVGPNAQSSSATPAKAPSTKNERQSTGTSNAPSSGRNSANTRSNKKKENSTGTLNAPSSSATPARKKKGPNKKETKASRTPKHRSAKKDKSALLQEVIQNEDAGKDIPSLSDSEDPADKALLAALRRD